MQLAVTWSLKRLRSTLERSELQIRCDLRKVIQGYEAGVRPQPPRPSPGASDRQAGDGEAPPCSRLGQQLHEWLGHLLSELTDSASNAWGSPLGWRTPSGGDVLLIETTMPGKGMVRDRQLRQVMKESVEIALSYVRCAATGIPSRPRAAQPARPLPAGAVPKDGPSAGITIAMALISLLTDAEARSATSP